ncbi:MAG: DinB family protein [Anaerolineales bacterium]|nr:DinB family protein [Anaerolineales bacterium]
MTLTILFDLDETLLQTNMDETFLPAYLHALSKALSGYVPPGSMVPALMAGTEKMIANRDPSKTLADVFKAEFYTRLGISGEVLEPVFNQFYEDVYPGLGYLTRPVPDAIRLVRWAVDQGCRIAVATNPVFPLKAVIDRLEWAGLDPQEFPFAVISAFDDFHFTKPDPAYYHEFLAYLGWPDDPILVIGDNFEWDVHGPHQAGLASYWVAPECAEQPEGTAPNGRGPIGEVINWLKTKDWQEFRPVVDTPAALEAQFRSIPAALSTMLRSLPPESWTSCPGEDEWSVTEIICHLRDVDRDVNLPRIKNILGNDNPFVPGINADAWADERSYKTQDGQQAWCDFFDARRELHQAVQGLTQSDWKRPARHAIFGPTTMLELVKFMAEHDRLHIRQMWRALQINSGN